MKPISFVLIFYILFLLTQPCQDVFAAPKGVNVAADVQQTEHEEKESDECSPFCICSCCSLNVGYHSLTSVVEPKSSISAHRINSTIYCEPHRNNFSDSIWQPPKH